MDIFAPAIPIRQGPFHLDDANSFCSSNNASKLAVILRQCKCRSIGPWTSKKLRKLFFNLAMHNLVAAALP